MRWDIRIFIHSKLVASQIQVLGMFGMHWHVPSSKKISIAACPVTFLWQLLLSVTASNANDFCSVWLVFCALVTSDLWTDCNSEASLWGLSSTFWQGMPFSTFCPSCTGYRLVNYGLETMIRVQRDFHGERSFAWVHGMTCGLHSTLLYMGRLFCSVRVKNSREMLRRVLLKCAARSAKQPNSECVHISRQIHNLNI